MKQTTRPLVTLALTVAALIIAGCGQSTTDPQQESANAESSTTATNPSPELPSSLIAAEPIENGVGVVEARKTVEPGKEVVLTGFIGGRAFPFVDGRAIFSLADAEALAQCSSLPGDNCKTPWDACCEDPDTITASLASIQVVDADGNVAKEALEGVGGLEPGAIVTVQGTIAPTATADALIVNAKRIHVDSAP